ncbi:hypothetical protein [Lysobacter gummosus]|uniref:hypothetical protein n=1 Tax=Lysobacter gummosus TaxID=262324 RepID=UPI00362C9E0F
MAAAARSRAGRRKVGCDRGEREACERRLKERLPKSYELAYFCSPRYQAPSGLRCQSDVCADATAPGPLRVSSMKLIRSIFTVRS